MNKLQIINSILIIIIASSLLIEMNERSKVVEDMSSRINHLEETIETLSLRVVEAEDKLFALITTANEKKK